MDVHQIPNVRQAKNNSFINVTPRMTTTPGTYTVSTVTVVPPGLCHRNVDYSVGPAVIAAVGLVFGLLYCFLGYRFFKATMFVTGLVFGGVVSYIVCLEEELLPMEGKVGVSLLVGILVGLITMLAHHVGLFMTGFCEGGLLGIGGLIITEWFTTPPSVWVCIGAVFIPGLLSALFILRFQRSLTLVGTSLVGAAMLTVGIDYYVEKWIGLRWVSERLTLTVSPSLCWSTCFILALWPTLFIFGLIVQCTITAKNIHHKKVVNIKRKRKKVNLQKVRDKSEAGEVRSPKQPDGNNRYLHLYQVRRVNGDVISQSYIQSIQHKLSTAVRKKVVATPSSRPPAQPSVECDPMQASQIEYIPNS